MTVKTLVLITILFTSYFASGYVVFQNSDVPIDVFGNFGTMKERCDKIGGPGTFDKLKASKQSLQTCITQSVNPKVAEVEFMDAVLNNYCKKRSTLEPCVQNFIDKFRSCLDFEENKALNSTLSVLKPLGDFVCYRDGDIMEVFVIDGGVECIQNRSKELKNCVNSIFKVEPNQKKCDDLDKLHICVFEEIGMCVPFNMNQLFISVKNSICSTKKLDNHHVVKRNSAQKLFKAKCDKNRPNGGYEALTLEFEIAITCLRNKVRAEPIFVTPLNDFKENVNSCVEDLVEKAKTCLSKDEQYVPNFYLDYINHLTDFVYANKDILLSPSTRAELGNCYQNFKQPSAKNEVWKCLKASGNNDSLKKEDICGEVTGALSCLSGQVKKRCSQDMTIIKLMDGFSKVVVDLCK